MLVADTAEVMGTQISPGALRIFVQDLAHLPDENIRQGLERTRREVKGSNGFPPRLILQDVLDRAGVISPADAESMEATAAWDMVMDVVERFVKVKRSEDGSKPADSDVVLRRIVGKPLADCVNCEGKGMKLVRREDMSQWVVPCDCKPVVEIPAMSDRLLDVVRRMGGWVTFYAIPAKSFPFVRRDFMLEFGKWQKVENYRSALPAGESMLAIGNGEKRLAIGDGTPHKLDGLLDSILSADMR